MSRNLSPNTMSVAAAPAELASAIHLEFIQNLAAAQSGGGADEVESYHRAIFLYHHGKDLERFRQQRRIQEDRVEHVESRLKETRERLNELKKWVPVDHAGQPDLKPNAPWNLWDRSMFAAAMLGIVVLLVFGVLNVSFNLLESGIVTFLDHPIRAYFWAALLPAGALGVKVGWDLLKNEKARSAYLWACLAVGLAGVLVWVAAYATVYPTLSRSTAEMIGSVSVFDAGTESASSFAPGGAKRIDTAIVASQALAEICLSAVLGMYMTSIYVRHRPVRLAKDPSFVRLDDERGRLEDTLVEARSALGEAKGNEEQLENRLAAFLAYARSLFEKEVALSRDQNHQQRRLLDQIEEQLRTQLEAVRNGRETGADRADRALADGGRNGS